MQSEDDCLSTAFLTSVDSFTLGNLVKQGKTG